MKTDFRKFLAALLAMLIVLSAVGIVWADSESNETYQGTIVVYNGEISPETGTPMEKDDEGVWTMTGDIEGTENYGLWLISEPEWDEDEEEDVKTEDAVPSRAVVDGDVKASSKDDNVEASGVFLEAKDGIVDVKVTGKASSETIVEGGDAPSAVSYGVNAETWWGEEDCTITAEVGSASAKAVAQTAFGDGAGVNVSASAVEARHYSGSMKLTVNEGLTAEATAIDSSEDNYADSNANGLDIKAAKEFEATIDGKVSATAKATSENETGAKAYGIEIESSEDAETDQVKVTVNDKISAYAEATGSGGYLYAKSAGIEESIRGGSNTLTAKGDITAEAKAEGDCTEEFEVFAAGVSLEAAGESDNTVSITGDVAATVTASNQSEADETDIYATGISFTVADAKFDAAIEGDVSAVINGDDGEAVGLNLDVHDYGGSGDRSGGTISVTLTGDTKATGGEKSTGIVVGAVLAPSELTFSKDDISDQPADEPDEGTIQYCVDLERDGEEYTIVCTIEEENGEKVKKFYREIEYRDDDYKWVEEYYPISNVEEVFQNKAVVSLNVAEGDVTADTVGIEVTGNAASDIDLFVNGAVDGGKTAVLLSEEAVIGENVTLTVWKLENADDKFVTRAKAGGNDSLLQTAAGDAEASETAYENISDEEYGKIQYILRIEASQEDYIATDAGKKVNGYDVANENQKVTLKLTPPEGYEITGAFNGEGDEKVELTKDEEGNYYVTVERGGGVYLSVTYEKKEEEKKEEKEEQEEQQEEEKKEPSKAERENVEPEQEEKPLYKTVTIDPDGGIVENRKNAAAYTMTVVQGASITLPGFSQAKEGCELLGWYPSNVGRGQAGWVEPDPEKDADKFLKPGEKITVDRSMTLTAIWKKK